MFVLPQLSGDIMPCLTILTSLHEYISLFQPIILHNYVDHAFCSFVVSVSPKIRYDQYFMIQTKKSLPKVLNDAVDFRLNTIQTPTQIPGLLVEKTPVRRNKIHSFSPQRIGKSRNYRCNPSQITEKKTVLRQGMDRLACRLRKFVERISVSLSSPSLSSDSLPLRQHSIIRCLAFTASSF